MKQTAESSVCHGREFRKSALLAKQDKTNPLSDNIDRKKKTTPKAAAEVATLLIWSNTIEF